MSGASTHPPSSGILGVVALTVVAAVAVTTYAISKRAPEAPAVNDQAATTHPAGATADGLRALARINGKPCEAVLSITRINPDDYNMECAIGLAGERRAMYLVSLRSGIVR